MTRVLKWPVPIDDQLHPVGRGKVALVDCQGTPLVVTVWTVEHDDDPEPVPATVVGTGHPVPPDMEHVGSCQAVPFVWHVFRGTW